MRPGAFLSGARPKSLVTIDGEPRLVKFSEGEEIDTPLVEHAILELARSCGIHAATTLALAVGSGYTVAVRRFDRAGPARLHAISANVPSRAAGEAPGYSQFA